MKNDNTTVTKKETLAALRRPGELYAVMSQATKLPFVVCDEETFDDEVFLYYRLEDAKEKARQLTDRKYPTAVGKLEEKQLLAFYTSLYAMGVNCLVVNSGTDTQISVQLTDLVTRKKPEDLPEGSIQIENPELHLTAIYLMQEMRRQNPSRITEELKNMQEEMMAHYRKGTFLVVLEENGQVPILKQKDGTIFQPIFTDVMELQKFVKGKKVKTAAVPAAKIPSVLPGEARGVVINPFGVNVQLQISRKQPCQ
ncbi:SseB family protein [Clostridium sp. Marseille-P3244]|uniref:SseB family protein n=1 Tax=Clostridium sp. Marseille-P3244 TaxID=1871020 RepID=UPI00092FE183|nr:SseB family protein [Clostridium sp. Marseille-P3244]